MSKTLLKQIKPSLVNSVLVACCLVSTANAGIIDYTFTNAGQIGRFGPSQSQVDIAYSGETLDGSVIALGGIQSWSAQYTGVYNLTAYGAQGAQGSTNNNIATITQGGFGAIMQGDFFLNVGDILNILIGQSGSMETSYYHRSGGGGGGTFVTTDLNSPLIIAGGGGGGGTLQYGQTAGDSGHVGTSGSQNGGTNGSGGQIQSIAGAGGGFIGNGDNYPSYVTGGKSFLNGGAGGVTSTWATEAFGGFGGGGAGALLGGGGGGYSGGGSTGAWAGSGTAGGGGSHNVGANQINHSSLWEGHGMLNISFDDTQLNNKKVPEPSTLAIFALGMIGLASRRFKKQS
jgi:hypothetical protein